jgi:hypothetical protein
MKDESGHLEYAAIHGWGASFVIKSEGARTPRFHLCGNTLRANAPQRRGTLALGAERPALAVSERRRLAPPRRLGAHRFGRLR